MLFLFLYRISYHYLFAECQIILLGVKRYMINDFVGEIGQFDELLKLTKYHFHFHTE